MSPMHSDGTVDLEAHDRLEDGRPRLGDRVLERPGARDLERRVRGIDLVVLAVHDRHLDVLDRVSGDDAARHDLPDPLLDRGSKLRGIVPPKIAHLYSRPVPGCAGATLQEDLGELAAAAALLLVAVMAVGWRRDRLLVRHLRPARVDVDPEPVAQALELDVDVQRAQPRRDELRCRRLARRHERSPTPRRACASPRRP